MYWTGTLRLNAKEAPLLLKVWNPKSLAFNPMEVRIWAKIVLTWDWDIIVLTWDWVIIVSLP